MNYYEFFFYHFYSKKIESLTANSIFHNFFDFVNADVT